MEPFSRTGGGGHMSLQSGCFAVLAGLGGWGTGLTRVIVS